MRRAVIADDTLTVVFLTRGAILYDLRLAGVPYSLTLGAPDLSAYDGPLRYFGALVGPVANRISGGSAELGGRVHAFARNEAGRTTLHSGPEGIHARNRDIETRIPIQPSPSRWPYPTARADSRAIGCWQRAMR